MMKMRFRREPEIPVLKRGRHGAFPFYFGRKGWTIFAFESYALLG